MDKFKFTPGQLQKVVIDIKNPGEKVEPSEYSVIEQTECLFEKTARAVAGLNRSQPSQRAT